MFLTLVLGRSEGVEQSQSGAAVSVSASHRYDAG